jgi:hypothetical protein
MHINSGATTSSVRRRDFILLLAASAPALPALSGSDLACAASVRHEAAVESVWKTKGRMDAKRGIFHPPHEHIGWPYSEDFQEAETQYSVGYWDEFGRLRFQQGDYDLL